MKTHGRAAGRTTRTDDGRRLSPGPRLGRHRPRFRALLASAGAPGPETGTLGRRRPAVIAAVQDVAGSSTDIQRIFVDPHRPGWSFKPLRLSLGRIKGSALRLGPVRDTIMLAASGEDGLALRQMFVGASF